jgi:hypothetical protein
LHAEREVLLDDLAEESRLVNLPPRKVSAIREMILEKHDECLQALREYPDVEIDDVIKAYRGLIWKLLKS